LERRLFSHRRKRVLLVPEVVAFNNTYHLARNSLLFSIPQLPPLPYELADVPYFCLVAPPIGRGSRYCLDVDNVVDQCSYLYVSTLAVVVENPFLPSISVRLDAFWRSSPTHETSPQSRCLPFDIRLSRSEAEADLSPLTSHLSKVVLALHPGKKTLIVHFFR
jgi:hypothetical protein